MTQCSGCVGIGHVNRSPELTGTLPIKAAFRSGIILILGRRVQRSERRIYAFLHAVLFPYRPIAPDGLRAIDPSSFVSRVRSFCRLVVALNRLAAVTTMHNRTILITGASKGIGRALSSILTDAGHQVIGIAREEDASFPGELLRVDLADPRATMTALADLVARRPIDSCSKQRRTGETSIAWERWSRRSERSIGPQPAPCASNCSSCLTGNAVVEIRENRQHIEPYGARHYASHQLCSRKSRTDQFHSQLGLGACDHRDHRQCRRTGSHRNGTLSREQPAGESR